MLKSVTFSVATVLAVASLTVVTTGTASAASTMSATPSSGLTAGQNVHVVVSGLNAVPFANVKVAQCANALADGTPLGTVVPATDCHVFADAAPSPSGEVVVDYAVKQTAIGTGNRACYASVVASCDIRIVESTNQTSLPSAVALSFAGDPANSELATSTVLTPVGSPVGIDKAAHVRVAVSTVPGFVAQGSVTIYEGVTAVGSGNLAGGAADIALDPLSLGSHSLIGEFTGDGSYANSSSASATTEITAANNISIGDASVVEGPAGAFHNVVFPVTLSHRSNVDMTVQYDIDAGTADPGIDVADTTKVLKFRANLTTVKYIVVKVIGDSSPELDQTFSVRLSNPTNGYALRRAVGTGTIIDDDTSPPSGTTVDVGDSSVIEGDTGGNKTLRFAVTLSAPVPNDVGVTFAIAPQSGTVINGKRTSGADWGGPTTKTITIRATKVSKYFAVPVFPEVNSELDEHLTVTIVNVTGLTPAAGGRTSADGIILSDE